MITMSRTHTGGRRHEVSVEKVVSATTFLIALFMIFMPIVYLFYGSFRSDSPRAPGAHFTVDNWISVYGGSVYGMAFVNSLLLAVVVAALSVPLGGVLAWIITRTNAPGRRQLAPLLVVPLMISTLITTLAWIALLAPRAGFINATANALFGIRTVFNIYSFAGMVLVLVLHYASFAFLPIYAALRSVDASLEEASYMLGAGPIRTALKMTIALIWPTLAVTFLMILIFVSENFAVPTILGTASGYETLMTQIYRAISVEPARPQLAATAGTMLLSIAIVGTIWQRRILARTGHYITVGGKGGRREVSDIGRWKYIATAFVVIYILLSVVVPYLALIGGSFMKFVTPRLTVALFTTQYYERLLDWDYLRGILNTLLLAGGGGLLATFFFIFIAFLIKRSDYRMGNFGKFMDYAVIVPTMTPGLVLGVGLLWAYISFPVPIYGTLWILLLAYTTRFLGQGVRQARAAFVQISDELSEAATIAGASPLRAFKDVVLPLLNPTIISIATIMFIFFSIEISMTIVLFTPQSLTLAVLVWGLLEGGYLPAALALAVVQATLVFAALFVANRFVGTLRSEIE